MLYAVIDIGTNSVRFMLADYSDAGIFVIKNAKTTTRLGEGLYDGRNMLREDRMQASADAILKYASLAREARAKKIICTATSAVRDSANKADFIALVKKCADIDVNVISGETEAICGFTGALQGISNGEDALLIDIGGGSTEVTLKENGIINGTSFKCGCVRLRELFGKDYSAADAFVKSTVKVPFGKEIVWIGGTASACAMLFRRLTEYEQSKVHLCRIPISFLEELYEKVLSMTEEECCEFCSFDKKRGELLPYGLMSILHIMKTSGASSVTVSESGLMTGLIILDNNKA